MCVVSMVMDHYADRWGKPEPFTSPFAPGTNPYPGINPTGVPFTPLFQPPVFPSREEVAEFRKLLERAREYDKKHNEPDCELADKKAKLKKIAEELGVEIDFL